MKTACIIQSTAADLYVTKEPDDYVISIAQECGLFNRIVLAVPDVQESKVFEELALEWDVELVKGPIHDVTKRILAAAGDTNLIARVLLKRSYLDVKLVAEMIEIARNGEVDYVNLPLDFNYELAADIFTLKALERVDQLLVGNSKETRVKRFNPWYFMETSGFFNVQTHPGVDYYPTAKIQEIKEKLRFLEENQFCVPSDSPISAYAPIEEHLSKETRVLDIATGQGNGAIRLRQTAEKITGVDINPDYIAVARQAATQVNKDGSNIELVCKDALEFSRPENFDAITSIHTLEHLSNPKKFLDLCNSNLRDEGQLFIEVPLLLPRPLGEPLYPFHQKEYLKEEIEELLTKTGFSINNRLGRNRNFYTDIDKARESAQYHCSILTS